MATTDFADCQIILVTGGNRGFGKAILERLADHKKKTVLLVGCRDIVKGKEVARGLEERNGSYCRAVLINLGEGGRETIKQAVEHIRETYKRLDVLINNAGVLKEYSEESKTRTEPSVWADTMKVNFYSTKFMCEAFLSIVPSGGRIINIASGAGLRTLAILDPEHYDKLTGADTTQEDLVGVLDQLEKKVLDPNDSIHGRISTFAYGMSKGAVVIATSLFARSNPDRMIVSCTPGFVATDMSASYAGERIPENPYKMAEIVELCALENHPGIKSGNFVRMKGRKVVVVYSGTPNEI